MGEFLPISIGRNVDLAKLTAAQHTKGDLKLGTFALGGNPEKGMRPVFQLNVVHHHNFEKAPLDPTKKALINVSLFKTTRGQERLQKSQQARKEDFAKRDAQILHAALEALNKGTLSQENFDAIQQKLEAQAEARQQQLRKSQEKPVFGGAVGTPLKAAGKGLRTLYRVGADQVRTRMEGGTTKANEAKTAFTKPAESTPSFQPTYILDKNGTPTRNPALTEDPFERQSQSAPEVPVEAGAAAAEK